MDSYQKEPYGQDIITPVQSSVTLQRFMGNVFLWMFVALGISAAVAALFMQNMQWYAFMFNDQGGLNFAGYGVMLAPLGFVLLMSAGFSRFSSPILIALFIAYSAINGISFGFILPAYTSTSVVGCFLSAAAMFGVMAFMGYTTDKDLTSFGRILTMALIGIVIASVINFFMKSDSMGYIISIIGVLVFTGLTAYDVQKLKRIGEGLEYQDVPADQPKKLAIMGALNLYLDFINLFLFLLRIFGRRD